MTGRVENWDTVDVARLSGLEVGALRHAAQRGNASARRAVKRLRDHQADDGSGGDAA